jgi:hypothetical protein
MTAEQIRKLKQARSNQILPVKNTSIEQTIQNQLTNEGIEFEPHRRFWIRTLVMQLTFSSNQIFVWNVMVSIGTPDSFQITIIIARCHLYSEIT